MKESLINVNVTIKEQSKINGKWKTKNERNEVWTLEKVKRYMSDENIELWKSLSKQRIERSYTEYGYLPTKYYNTEKRFSEVRRIIEFQYK